MEELKSLVVRAQAGDLEAYGEVVRRFQDMAYGYAYSVLGDFHLAEDAAQEAFIEAYRCLAKLREPAAFPGWFRRIVFKHCDRVTRQRRLKKGAAEDLTATLSSEPGPPEVAEQREMRDTVLRAIRALPEDQRTATTLFYINGYSQKEIADFLEVTLAAVKTRLQASRKQLRERMLKMVGDELKANALDPSEMSGRIAFLLGLVERFAKGEPLLYILEALGKEAESESLRTVIRELHDSVDRGGTLYQSLARNTKLFPPMVVWLFQTGEYLGDLNPTTRMAIDWLQRGEYQVNPYAFAQASFSRLRGEIRKGVAEGVVALVIDTRRTKEVPRAKGKPHVAWLQRELPDGSLEDAWPVFGDVRRYLAEFKMLTILDEHQKGEEVTGKLRFRLEPQDATEVMLPITYRPFRDGEEVRILLQT